MNDGVEALLASLVGRTITEAVWHGSSDAADWPQGADSATLRFDDGRAMHVGSWGYDAWGVDLTELLDIEDCPVCHQSHQEVWVNHWCLRDDGYEDGIEGYGPVHLANGERFYWCPLVGKWKGIGRGARVPLDGARVRPRMTE